MNSPLDEIELMRKIAGQNQQAFHALYQQYGKAIYSLAYRVLQNSTLAEEVTQDTFLKVWRQAAHWDPDKGKLKNWLLTIAQFTAIDRLRQERRQPHLYPDPIEEAEETHILGGEAHWQDGTVLKLLIARLPDEQSRLIDMAFFQGMTHNDIANTTQIPLGTVKTRLRSGLQKLRELWLESVNRTSTP